MLPPFFWALAGTADSEIANPATRNNRASAPERTAAVMDAPSQSVVASGVPDRRWLTVRLSGIAALGKAVRTPRMKSRRVKTLSP
jgi:hypothetical protein